MDVDEFKNLNSVEIAQKISSGEFLLCHRLARSKIWSVFSRIMTRSGIENREYVYCKSCVKVFKYNKLTTSNLVKHKCYTNFLNAENEISIVEEEKPTVVEYVDTNVVNMTKLITKWITKDCRSYDLIQNDNLQAIFQELLRLGAAFGEGLNIDRLLPTVPEIAKSVTVIYEQCFINVKAEIASIKDKGFSLTTDIWTDNVTRQNYIALTIHYLKNGVLKCHLLGLQTIEEDISTHQNVAGKVKRILGDFDCKLSSKTIIVTDEDADFFKSIADAKHLPCLSQLLDSALLKSVLEVPQIVEIKSRCSKLVSYLKESGHNNLLGLQSSYPHRWISIYKMINSIENNWYEIEKTIQTLVEVPENLNINIHHLRALTKTCQPFAEAIETLEDDSYATLHLVMVYLHELKKSCNTIDSEIKDFDFIESLKESILFNMEQIVTENITNIHKLALFLYPPTNKLLQFTDEEKESIEGECVRLMQCFKDDSKPKIKQERDLPSTPVSKRRKLFSDFIESQANCDPNELILQEIQYYKNTRVVNGADFDLFGWWELQKDNFPILYKLSSTILATPATSAASKRILTSARSLLCERGYEGTNETEADKIMFINANADLAKPNT